MQNPKINERLIKPPLPPPPPTKLISFKGSSGNLIEFLFRNFKTMKGQSIKSRVSSLREQILKLQKRISKIQEEFKHPKMTSFKDCTGEIQQCPDCKYCFWAENGW